jgi:undecaprenyl-diphosphatase
LSVNRFGDIRLTAFILLPVLLALGVMAPVALAEGNLHNQNRNYLKAQAEEAAAQAREAGFKAKLLDLTQGALDHVNLPLNQAKAQMRGFAVYLASQNKSGRDVGQIAPQPDLLDRFGDYVGQASSDRGLEFLQAALAGCREKLGISPKALLKALLNPVLGLGPAPQDLEKRLIQKHLARLFIKNSELAGEFVTLKASGLQDAIRLIWHTKKIHGLLTKGSSVGVLGPISGSQVRRLGLNGIAYKMVEAEPQHDGRMLLSSRIISKLTDLDYNILVILNPQGEGSGALKPRRLKKLVAKIKKEHPDLMLVCVNSGAAINRDFISLAEMLPQNVILVYSFEDYLGAQGAKVAYIALHPNYKGDKHLAKLPEPLRKAVARRYGLSRKQADHLTFVQRLTLEDQRARKPGLYAPVQSSELIWPCLFALMDQHGDYAAQVRQMWQERYRAFEKSLGMAQVVEPRPGQPLRLDLTRLAVNHYGMEFGRFINGLDPWQFLRDLAIKRYTLALSDGGEAKSWLLELNLGGLSVEDCKRAAKNISFVLKQYHEPWDRENRPWLLSKLNRADLDMFRRINFNWQNSFFDAVMPWISDLIPLVPVIMAAFWLIWTQRVRGLWIIGGLVLLFLLTDSITTQLWRPLFERPRPYAALQGIRYCFGQDWHISTAQTLAQAVGTFGLPSAHAANSMGPAIFVMRFSPRVGAILVACSFVVGLSRVYLGLHYPGDIIVGMAWGGLCGGVMAWLTRWVMVTAGKWPRHR